MGLSSSKKYNSKNKNIANKNIANKLAQKLRKKYPHECKKISLKSHRRLIINHLNNKNISNMLYGKTKPAKRIKRISKNNFKIYI